MTSAMTDRELLQEVRKLLTGPLINTEAKNLLKQTAEAEYECGSKVVAIAIGYLLNTEKRHRATLERINKHLEG
jgi:hypothetical protein